MAEEIKREWPFPFSRERWEEFCTKAFVIDSGAKRVFFSNEDGLRNFIKILNDCRDPLNPQITMDKVEPHLTRHRDGSIAMLVNI